MPEEMSKPKGKHDIFALLVEDAEKRDRTKRTQLLKSLKVKEFFKDGTISINGRTCQGLECELCIKACPTKALYWQDGKIGIVNDLCVYCGSCVLNCIVDDCIKVTRKRDDGKEESFSTPNEVVMLFKRINDEKRRSRIESILPNSEAYLKRYPKNRE
jgi:ferredoxin